MPTAIVQDAYGFITDDALTIGSGSPGPWSAPVVGNRVLAALSVASAPGTPSIPGFATFDAVRSNAANSIRVMLAHKAATALDTSIAMASTQNDNMVGHAIEISGLGTTPVLHAIATPVEANAATSLAFGNITITDPESILVAVCGFVGGQPGTSRPLISDSFISTGALNRYGCCAYRRPGSAGTYTVTFTWTNTINAYGFLAAIAPAAAGGGGGGGGGMFAGTRRM